VLRFALGAALLALVYPYFNAGNTRYIAIALGWAIGLAAFYAFLQFVLRRVASRISRWVGAILAFAPLIVVFGTMGAPGQVGAQTFLGLSLLAAAWRADAGCEVMSLPGLLMGQRTHLMCLLFSPIDSIETRFASHNG
jgi:hypothetical protein